MNHAETERDRRDRARVVALLESYSKKYTTLYARAHERGMDPWTWAHPSCTHTNQALFELGTERAKKEHVLAGWCITLDDIGTKVQRKPPSPTFIIETRPGNAQFVYVLDKPVPLAKHEPLIKALRVAGWTDPGASSGTLQWFRLPGSLPPKKPCAARLARWSGKRFSYADLVAMFNVKPGRHRVFKAGPAPDTAQFARVAEAHLALVEMLHAMNLVKGVRKGGIVDLVCPRVAEHTDGDDSGTVLLPPCEKNRWKGAFHCSHSHGCWYKLDEVYADLRSAK